MSGEYYLVSDIVPSDHTLVKNPGGLTSREDTFEVRRIRLTDRRENTFTHSVPMNHFEPMELLQFAPKMTQNWVGDSDIIGIGTGSGQTFSGFIMLMTDKDDTSQCINLFHKACRESNDCDPRSDFVMVNTNLDITRWKPESPGTTDQSGCQTRDS